MTPPAPSTALVAFLRREHAKKIAPKAKTPTRAAPIIPSMTGRPNPISSSCSSSHSDT
eukprot:CAMPEP_0169228348 /NCGR_PEP_ID=MMETSP1016-20121227/24787_2 /TAXON_ID=342587 /ORGANISM="Karlodinium micrum, Strain CCMP2283" /LENGTH=57 /DNA_ID=CAMNT_0009307123 /DNA_START=474 /DNA_END=644 /DNA_ORIENTATION=-